MFIIMNVKKTDPLHPFPVGSIIDLHGAAFT
jgi:hypothetical protein